MVSSLSSIGTLPSNTTGTTTPTGQISFSGLVSGVNTAALIASLVAAKSAPITSYQKQVTANQAESTAIGEINTRLGSLLTLAQQFSDPSYMQGTIGSVAPGSATAGPTVSVTTTAGAATGSFKVTVNHLASATQVSSPTAIGAAIDPAAVLNTTNIGTPLTAGTFTVNGHTVTIDPAVDTLNSVISKIQAAAPGVTASLVNDASGRPNLLQISAAAGVALGSGADTSNFLSATNLLASPGTTTRVSTADLGVAIPTGTLAGAHLATALSPASGSFQINGQTITWDATQDNLNNVISQINGNTAANVTASYNAANDSISLISKNTGSTSIQLQDTTGNFLAAMGLTGATQQLGQNAQYQIDSGNGPVTAYSTSNSVQNALPGVTLNLLQTGTAADTVTVGADVASTVSKVQAFVTAINGVLDDITKQTSVTPPPPTTPGQAPTTAPATTNGPLSGNTDIQAIADRLHTMLASPMPGNSSTINTLSQIGISFGAIGSAAGTTNDLVIDTTKLTAAIQSNPTSISSMFAALTTQATVQAGGAGNVASLSGTPYTKVFRAPGSFVLSTTVNGDGTANISALFTPLGGGHTLTSTAFNVAPGSSNSSLIAGLTLQFGASFTAGNDTLNITTPSTGLEAQLEQYLTPLTGAAGTLSNQQTGFSSVIASLNSQITTMNAQVASYKTMLISKFTAMEVSLQALQQSSSELTAAGFTGSLTVGTGTSQVSFG